MRKILLSLVFLSSFLYMSAQNNAQSDALAKQLVTANAAAIGMSQYDVNNYIVSSSYFNETGNTQMVYLVQGYKGLPVWNQMLVLAFRDGKLLSKAGAFLPNMDQLTSGRSATPSVSAPNAVRAAFSESNLAAPVSITQRYTPGTSKKLDFGTLGMAKENVTAELMWVPVMDGANMTSVKLAWQVELYPLVNADYWSIRVDASNSSIVSKNNLTIYENYNNGSEYLSQDNFLLKNPEMFKKKAFTPETPLNTMFSVVNNTQNQTNNSPSLVGTANYTVIKYPAEAPSFPGGAAQVVTNPWLAAGGLATTFGWHNDGAVDYTASRGNNVHAHEDRLNNNSNAGLMAQSTTVPDPLNFTYAGQPDYTAIPTTPLFQQFAITQLFYWNNIMHDITYKYGFNEVSGNFQNNNQALGGLGVDYVQADAQDGGGTNNANFATPVDGVRPRMQMYLFNPAAGILTFVVNSPASIAGPYAAIEGAFSPSNLLGNVGPRTANLVWYNDDATGVTHYACNPAFNAAALTGKIALIMRGFGGPCPVAVNFTTKVANAQLAGAIGVVMVNNVPGPPIVMGGGPDPTIITPAIMISDVDGATIAAQLTNPFVNVTMSSTPPGTVQLDGDIDNGVVSHEFFHGVSNRLTGGPANSSCLNNAEEGGEGWGDINALFLTTDWSTALVTDGFNKKRPVGTYAFGQSPTGSGIRLYPYCTDMTFNPLTYASMGVPPVGTEVHNIGEIWCMALWEMTWKLIQTNGINANLYNNAGTQGNVVAYKLIMEGMRLQPCLPGYVDARNAILQADQNLYGGIHVCDIWVAFAKRGLGFSANQGSSNSATDQTPAFDLPPGAAFTTQPANTTTCVGSNASFTAVAAGATYQWQVSTTGCGGTFTNLTNTGVYTGVTTSTLNITGATLAMNGYAYRAVGTTTCGSSNSNCAVLTVVAAAVGGTVTPANTTVCSTPNSTLLTLTGNVGPVSQWESSTVGCAGPWNAIPGTAGQQTYTAVNVTATTYYRAFISAVGCASAGSSCATITQLPGALPMFIVADPGTTVCAGDPTRLTVMEGAAGGAVTVSATGGNTTVGTGLGVSCGTVVTTAVNSYWRAYNLTTFPAVTGNLTINSVRFGVESSTGGPQNVTINLYNQTGGAFPGGTRTLIPGGTVTVSVPNLANAIQIATFAVPPVVTNTQTIVVEVQTAGAVGTRYFPGATAAAETSPSYISATACAINAPVTYASIGFPQTHLIQDILGTLQPTGGIVVGGTFTWTPAAGLSSTSTNPVAASPMVTTTYTVQHNNGAGCIRTAQITINVNTRPTVTTHPTNTNVCTGSQATFTAAGTGTGLTYQWQVSTDNGATWNNVPAAPPYTGTTGPTLTINPTSAAMNGYRYRVVLSGTCPPAIPGTPNISNSATLTLTALPTVSITPVGPVCGGIAGINGVMLTTGGTSLPPIPGSVTATTGTISVILPDPAPAMAPTINVLNVAGIPVNATITGVTVTMSMPHTYPADMTIALKAPNNSILSLFKHNTQTDNGTASVPGAGFFNAVISSTGTTQFKAVPNPYKYGITAPTGPFAPDVLNGTANPGYPAGSDPVGYVSNATGFSSLYTTGGSANGAWTLAMADAGGGDPGTLTNWQIKIDYTTPNPAVPFNYVWTPAAGLYLDATASTPYVPGSSQATVYAAPTVNTLYTVTITDNTTLCSNSATVQVNYTPNKPTVNPTSVAMCLGDAPVPITITSSLAPTVVSLTTTHPAPGLIIPDGNANGVQSVINVAAVPVGAVISAMSVTLNLRHTYPADMIINLKAPGGQILSLYKHNGGVDNGTVSIPTAGWFNAVVNNTSAVAFNTVPAPYRYGITVPVGPYKPDALVGTVDPNYPAINDPAGFVANSTTFPALWVNSPNGAWTLAMADGGLIDDGTLDSWSLNFTYGTPSVGIWSPTTGLYTNATGTPYTGTPIQTVYAQPTTVGVNNYSVTVSTGTCTSAPTIVPVTVNAPVAITSVSANAVVCTNGTTSFTVVATGSALTYQWQVSTNGGTTWTNIVNGAPYSGATTATLTITSPSVTLNGALYRVVVSGGAPCPSVNSANRTLTVNPLPTVTISAAPYQALYPGLTTTITVNSSPAAASYVWRRNGVVIPGVTTSSYVADIDHLGNYVVTVTDVNGCVGNSNTLTIGDSTSGRVFIYPNPNSGRFQVRYNPMHNAITPYGLKVFDAMGKLVLNQKYTLGVPYAPMVVDLSNMATGVYWVEVVDIDDQRLAMGRVEILR